MTPVNEHEPPGWRDLCAKLQTAKDVEEFQGIVEQINRLLTAYEKVHPETLDTEPKPPVPRKRVSSKPHRGSASNAQ